MAVDVGGFFGSVVSAASKLGDHRPQCHALPPAPPPHARAPSSHTSARGKDHTSAQWASNGRRVGRELGLLPQTRGGVRAVSGGFYLRSLAAWTPRPRHPRSPTSALRPRIGQAGGGLALGGRWAGQRSLSTLHVPVLHRVMLGGLAKPEHRPEQTYLPKPGTELWDLLKLEFSEYCGAPNEEPMDYPLYIPPPPPKTDETDPRHLTIDGIFASLYPPLPPVEPPSSPPIPLELQLRLRGGAVSGSKRPRGQEEASEEKRARSDPDPNRDLESQLKELIEETKKQYPNGVERQEEISDVQSKAEDAVELCQSGSNPLNPPITDRQREGLEIHFGALMGLRWEQNMPIIDALIYNAKDEAKDEMSEVGEAGTLTLTLNPNPDPNPNPNPNPNPIPDQADLGEAEGENEALTVDG